MTVGTGIGQQLSSRALIGSFYDTLAGVAVPAWVPATAQRVDSNQASEDLKWLGMAPAMREWVGGRNAKGFQINGITIANKTFEATLEVDLDDVRRDKTGQLLSRVNDLAFRAEQHRAKLLSDLIIAGESTACYDTQFFFDTDHNYSHVGGEFTTAQDNDLGYDISDAGTGGTATAPTIETVQGAILRAVAQIYSFKDDRGEPMNEDAAEFTVMVPVPFMNPAMGALTLPMIGGGNSNLLTSNPGFRLSLAVNPRLTWTTKLAVFRTDGRVKPLIEQVEYDPVIDAIAEGSEMEIKERKHLYTVTRYGNVAYGYWQHACLVTLAA
jgi:phage major head subunit gpT-like protein